MIALGDIDRSIPFFWPDNVYLAKDQKAYDGYFYFNLALDPLDRRGVGQALDQHPAYRHVRIGYPLLAKLVALGQDRLIPWSLWLVNLLAIVMTSVAIGLFAQRNERSGWWGGLWPLAPGLCLALFYDLAEPTWLLFISLGLIACIEQKYLKAACWLSLAMLTRETTLVIIFGLLLQRRIITSEGSVKAPRAWVWGPLGVFALAQLAVKLHYGAFSFQGGQGNLANPTSWLDPLITGAVAGLWAPGAIITLTAFTLAISGFALGAWAFIRRSPLGAALATYSLFTLLMSQYVWGDLVSLGRNVAAPITLMILLLALRKPVENSNEARPVFQKLVLLSLMLLCLLNIWSVISFFGLNWPKTDRCEFISTSELSNEALGNFNPDLLEVVIIPEGLEGQPTFIIDRTEVTNRRYRQYLEARSNLKSSTYAEEMIFDDRFADHPVTQVDYFQARNYCRHLGGDLPTERQWERAAGYPDGRTYPWGDQKAQGQINGCDAFCYSYWRDSSYNDGFARLAPVGSFPDGKSLLGLVDLAGNAWEWTRTPITEKTGKARLYVLKGGAFSSMADDFRIRNQGAVFPKNHGDNIGFRCIYNIN